jgi:hypothetical protein
MAGMPIETGGAEGGADAAGADDDAGPRGAHGIPAGTIAISATRSAMASEAPGAPR